MRYFISLVLVGCGGGLCSRDVCGEPPTDAEIASCEESLADCNAADEALLGDFADCLEANVTATCATTPPTDPQAALDDLEALGNCMAPMTALSDACSEAQGFSVGTPSGA
ncbi:MAG: hypothetical protein ABMA64_36705 [Myxococcota bacterium]